MNEEAIRFYCGISEMVWNHHPVAPGPYACVSPIYGRREDKKRTNTVVVPDGVAVIQDSGAFSDGPGSRLEMGAALERQIAHAEQYHYTDKVTHRASYDLLIDEKWIGGVRSKARWTEADAEEAVRITVQAARYLNTHRQAGIGAILSAQGVSATQYLACAQQIIPLFEPGDIFGLGGFCITGKRPGQMLPVFFEIIEQVIPFLGREQVKRVHIWGVCFAPALGALLRLCDAHGIALSTDSMGPSVRPANGRWGYAEWTNPHYQKPPCEVLGLDRARHVALTRAWLANFRATPHYRPAIRQLRLPLEEVSAWNA
jgi:hypothetical protein